MCRDESPRARSRNGRFAPSVSSRSWGPEPATSTTPGTFAAFPRGIDRVPGRPRGPCPTRSSRSTYSAGSAYEGGAGSGAGVGGTKKRPSTIGCSFANDTRMSRRSFSKRASRSTVSNSDFDTRASSTDTSAPCWAWSALVNARSFSSGSAPCIRGLNCEKASSSCPLSRDVTRSIARSMTSDGRMKIDPMRPSSSNVTRTST